MSEVALWVVAVLIAGAVAWVLGARRGRGLVSKEITVLLDELRSGRVRPPEGTAAAGSTPLGRMRRLLVEGWAPRGREREEVVRRALERMAAFLESRVEQPLEKGLKEGGTELAGGAQAALEALDDLEFFLEGQTFRAQRGCHNLVEVVQEVTREFTAQSEVLVNLMLPSAPLHVQMDPELTKDAIFLLLHNAGEFGGGGAVRITISGEGEEARVRIRDQGPGFTGEALALAPEPFYSTSPEGLGLGIPHALRAMRAQDGDVVIQNHPDGGAEVQVVIPNKGC